MSAKLNRDEILREILSTLVKGWGRKAVHDALDKIKGEWVNGPEEKYTEETKGGESKIIPVVENLLIPEERKILILKLARAYDAGVAFPKMSDVKAFLASHHQGVKDLRSRDQAFNKMIPILQRMSEKGLMKVISQSHYSGPVELGSISDAIKGAGQDMRGTPEKDNGEKN